MSTDTASTEGERKGPLPHEVEWLQLDLMERNKEVRGQLGFLVAQARFAVAFLAAVIALFTTGFYESSISSAWQGPLLLVIAFLYLSLGVKHIWTIRLLICIAEYGVSHLLPALGQYYNTPDPKQLYGWDSLWTSSGLYWRLGIQGTIADFSLYAIPFMILFVFGLLESVPEATARGTPLSLSILTLLAIVVLGTLGTTTLIQNGRGGADLRAFIQDHFEPPHRDRSRT